MTSSLSTSEKYVTTLAACALICLGIAVVGGVLSALCYLPWVAAQMQKMGLSLQQLRPIHTTFGAVWIFLGGITFVYLFLYDTGGPPTPAEKIRYKSQMICWGLAGSGILCTLPFGWMSGREYMEYHPIFSLLIWVGWVFFAWNFFARIRQDGFWHRPVYVYMWGVAILFFFYTFTEAHAYLLPWIRQYPLVDLQIQWKSYGTTVGAFNHLVYGTLIYCTERISGDRRYGQSPIAFALFAIGLLNSFTNFGHHTYHLPQSHLVKWIAFTISMLEIIILTRVFYDVVAILKRKSSAESFVTHTYLFRLAKYWTLGMLFLAILISIPPLNTFIHGTHAVMAHAMGAELGIDTYILLGAMAYLFSEVFRTEQTRLNHPTIHRLLFRLNLFLMILIGWLFISGTSVGLWRYCNYLPPVWVKFTPALLVFLGILAAYYFFSLLHVWLGLLLRVVKKPKI